MRTIDADRLKKSFEANTPIAFQDCVPGIHAIIDLEPTVEAKPVRHGKWIEEDDYEYGENVWRCSVCGEPYVLMEEITPKQALYNYCPYCGAKMDGADHG